MPSLWQADGSASLQQVILKLLLQYGPHDYVAVQKVLILIVVPSQSEQTIRGTSCTEQPLTANTVWPSFSTSERKKRPRGDRCAFKWLLDVG